MTQTIQPPTAQQLAQRPEWVRCALLAKPTPTTPLEMRKTWCGRPHAANEFFFQDSTHALLNARNEGRLMICAQCSAAMAAALAQGTADPSWIQETEADEG